MVGRVVILAAGLVYAVALVFVLFPPSGVSAPALAGTASASPVAPSPKGSTGLPYRSIGIQIQRVDWIDKYEQCIDQCAAIGADTVLFEVDGRQENGTSSRIYLDMRMTPTPEKLAQLIRHAKEKNLRVIIMPVILLDNPQGSEWRGTLKPESWDDWFDSYREAMIHFAWIAQGNGADVFVVGSELVSAEPHVDQWEKTISEIRKVFHGRLTYSSNWDHYTSVQFWDKLDLIGMNSYWKLGKDKDASVAEIQGNWSQIQRDLLTFVKKKRKPLMFIEVGWCSIANAASEPWDYTRTEEDLDVDLQKRLYEGFFRSWYGNAWLGGMSIWNWPPDDGGPEDKGYTPREKPAEKVLRDWYAKGPWKVN
jgi:hypothetical protein